MKTKAIVVSCCLSLFNLVWTGPSRAQESSIDTSLAAQYFQEADAICREDNGRLWGHSLCGPMLFVDPGTRMIVANQADAEGNLTKKGTVFVGRLPEKENIANTATVWAGVKWTMVMWPLSSIKPARTRLMMHELYHRIQEDIGLPASNPSNNHLDSLEGRVWLRLEWRALSAALTAQGAESVKAVEDALVFRSYRRSLFPDSDSNERGLEMNEGLAEYTATKLHESRDGETMNYLAKQLEAAENNKTFVRSFAYASGPAYGFLLDRSKLEWRKGLKPADDVGALLQRGFSIKLPDGLKQEAGARAPKYGGDVLRASETDRETKRQKRVAEYRSRFLDGPVLILTLSDQVRYSFNPNNLESLDGVGTVYPTLRVSDAWGILEVSNGALMMIEGGRASSVRVPAPADPTNSKIQGDGWTLQLNAGWSLAPHVRKGDYSVKKSA